MPVTIIRVNGGPEHENAWQRTGSFYLPVPLPQVLPYINKGGIHNYMLICIQTMSGEGYMKLEKVGEPREGSTAPLQSVSRRITLACSVIV